jgi:hypothetical protein
MKNRVLNHRNPNAQTLNTVLTAKTFTIFRNMVPDIPVPALLLLALWVKMGV